MENQTQPIAPSEVTYASFGKRYAAHMIDYVILTFFCSPLYSQIMRDVGRMRKYLPKIRGKYYRRLFGEEGGDYQSMMFGMDTTTMFFTNFMFIVTVGIVTWCYFAGMESSPMKATLGKKLLGLEVRDEDGSRVTFLQATGRHFAKILSGLVLYIGYLSMLGNSKHQTWHDSLSRCIVKEK
jgi:uncharacterized RDD family membrane protein YckC